jgi:hypothetical protein
MPLSETEIGPFAGNGREDIVDGPHLPAIPYAEGFASFAQPSGLASDGVRMFVADSEGASIRTVPFDPQVRVGTLVGTAHLPYNRLFVFGDKDGSGDDVRLQHPLGVAFTGGVLYVADTYNNKIKSIDPKSTATKTIAGSGKPGSADSPAQFDEPAGLTYADGKLYVADTNNHAIRTIDLKNGNAVATLAIAGLEPPANRTAPVEPQSNVRLVPLEKQSVRSNDGVIRLAVKLTLPEGFKINPLAPMNYRVDAVDGITGPVRREDLGKPVRVTPPAATFDVVLPVSSVSGDDQVRMTLNYYYCKEGKEGVCKLGSVAWQAPLTVSADGKEAANLEYRVE